MSVCGPASSAALRWCLRMAAHFSTPTLWPTSSNCRPAGADKWLPRGQDLSTAVTRLHRLHSAQSHAHRAIFKLGDLAERVQRGVGEFVDRRFVVTKGDEHRAVRRGFVDAGV